MKKALIALLFFPFTLSAQIITTIAGGGSSGLGDGGQATNAELDRPTSVAKDNTGNVYITDRQNNRIRKVSSTGIITTVAGTGAAGFGGDGTAATLATMNQPYGITVDNSGNIYFSDGENHRVRKINTAGIITTIAGTGATTSGGDGGQATDAQVGWPAGIAIDNSGNIYITESENHCVRKVSPSGIITTIAGTGMAGYSGNNGPAIAAKLDQPHGIALDATGNIYVVENNNDCVRKIDVSGTITTFAGGSNGYSGDNGPASAAKFRKPIGIAINSTGYIYIADVSNHCVREIDPSGIIHTVAGTGTLGFYGDGGNATAAKLSNPTGVAIDAYNNVYIADWGNDRVRTFRSSVSIEKVSNNIGLMNVHPNPNNGTFTLQVPSIMQEVAKVVVWDALGRQVTELVAPTNSPTPIELSEPPGIYFLSATTGDAVLNTKILISH